MAILLPAVGMPCRAIGMRLTGLLIWSVPTQRLMNATAVVVVEAVRLQLSLQIERIPKEDAIEILAAQSADESFHKWMRHGNMGNELDLVNFKYAQIR